MSEFQNILFLFIFGMGTIQIIAAFALDSDFEQEFGTDIRKKRDVLKGKDHDLLRSKRYIGRVPVAYMKKVNIQPQPYGDVEEEIGNNPVSHFREYNPRPEVSRTPSGTSNTHHQRRYVPNYDPDTSNLTDEEIQTLLLMLDGYDLNSRPNHKNGQLLEQYYPHLAPPNLDRVVQMNNVGKRETGKRSLGNYEQPMSFDNSLYPGADENQLEFLGNERTKRVGTRHLVTSSRVKKETDPSILANLDRVFSDDNTHSAGGETVELLKQKTKKSIDWSNYLGIDKRTEQSHKEKNVAESSGTPSALKSSQVTTSASIPMAPANSNPHAKLVSEPSATKTGKDSSKKEQERKENETVNKDDDRKWVLQEFYKNFAMMTNVKRKRESPPKPSEPSNDLERMEDLERKMTQVGDRIIWDALKYTGSHRDADMSPDELAKVKASIIDKLATAYSLEKVRDAVDELRQKVAAMENNPQA